MAAVADRGTEETWTETRQSAPNPFDFDDLDDLAEIINENFVLEVEACHALEK
jgi:hypothetical protein